MPIRNWYVEEGREAALRQRILAVPEMGGGNPPCANNPWQCQKWLARTAACQESLAVPELGGEHPPRARKPWQCQPWLGSRYASPNYVGDWVYKVFC